jgi:AraC family transcriptional regulator, regulatory protein of adaptative response / DNA-3-methyladenine glycosylase II
MTTYSAVVTTGIYCRPGCGARPLAANVRTYELAAAAEAAGFRACYRCRPYRVTDGPVPSDAPGLVCEAVQLVIGGALDDGGTEEALASRLGMSARHLRRLFLRHLGASPDQLARSRRAHFARRLLDDTDLTVLDIAFASGFGSLRQFNRTMQEVFRAPPTDLRARRRRADRLAADGGLALRLPCVPGYDWPGTLARLAAAAVPGAEAVNGAVYRRTIGMAGEPGLLEVSAGGDGSLVLCVHLPYWEGLIHLVSRTAQLLGTEGDAAPAWNPFEAGVRAILPRDALAAFVRELGAQVPGLPCGLDRVFPAPEAVTPAALAPLGLDSTAGGALLALAADQARVALAG